MSKDVDLSKPISDEEREYLKQRARHFDIEENDRQFKKGKFAEDHEEPYRGRNTVAAPPIEPGSDADNPPRFVGNRPHGVDRAVWGGSTGLSEQEAYAQTSGEPHAEQEELDLGGVPTVGGKQVKESDEPEEVAVEDLNVEQLKEELRKRDLPVGGNKDELVERLNEALESE